MSGDAENAPALLQAVRATLGTLERRARAYRAAVICVGVALVAPILLALARLAWRPLLLATLLVPVVGIFLVIDGLTVRVWQRRILKMWTRDALRLTDLRATFEGMRHLPTATVRGMLDRLPASERPDELDQLAAAARSSLVAGCLERARRENRRTALSAIGATLLACSLAATGSTRILVLLPVALLGLVLVIASRLAGWRSLA
jgi:hypothetical protein